MSTMLTGKRAWRAASVAVISILLAVSVDTRCSQQNAAPIESVTIAPANCLNQTTALIGEVSQVFGPRLFAVAAPGLDGDALVFVPGSRVAAVRTGLPVCVLGPSVPTPAVDLEHEWGTFERDHSPATTFPTTLLAEHVSSHSTDVVISAAEHAMMSDGASAARHVLTDVDSLANSTDTELVGRFVSLRAVRISIGGSRLGFWITTDNEELFVLPADDVHPQPGQRVNIKGVVLQLPEGMRNRLGDYRAARDEAIYVYVSQFRTL